MALARAHTWNPGDVLKSADLNGEFNNILNNPISLISPTTGAINFNLQAHVSLIPGAITATSATSGQALVSNGSTAAVWGSIGGSAVTSGVISAGAVLFFSTAASPLLDTLAIGTSGQVLTVSTSGKPSWQTPAALATIASIGAWGNATTNAIVNSANVASIASTAVGTIEATWTTPFQNATYVINVTAFSVVGREVYARVNRMSSSSATLSIHDQNGTLQADTFLFTVITSS